MPISELSSNSSGTKFFHPTLSSEEILTATILASAAYATTSDEFTERLSQQSETDASVWINVTSALTDPQYGLDQSFLISDPDDPNFGFFQNTNDYVITRTLDGTSEAFFLRNSETGQYAIAFRGTADGTPFLTGDRADWAPSLMDAHYEGFEPFLSAVNAFLAFQGTLTGETQDLLVTGHSLGAAMVEYFMAENPDNNSVSHTYNGVTYNAVVNYEAVAIASPEAAFDPSDARTLNIGHENDIVFSIINLGSTDVSNIYVSGIPDDLISQFVKGITHSIELTYADTISAILSSDYYSTTTPDSRVIVNFAETPQESRLLSRDGTLTESLILGRDSEVIRADGVTLSADDYLFGSGSGDIYEGFSGDDVYFVTVNGGDNTFSVGSGDDTIVVADRFELRGSTIDGLGIGDKIAFFDETTRALTQSDITIENGQIIIDGGLLFQDVVINADIPSGAELRVVDGALPLPNFGIPVYEIEKYLEVVPVGSADGPDQIDSGLLLGDGGSSSGVVTLTAPTFMSDGNASYTVSLGGIGLGVQYNIAYIIDTSGSMGGQRIVDARNAYIELTNQLTALGISANFAVIPFSSGATLYDGLNAQQAIDQINSLSAGGGTNFGPALLQAEAFFSSSATVGQTNIAYFLSDGQGSGASDSLQDVDGIAVNVQAFGIGSGANLSSLNLIDLDDARLLSSSDQLLDILTGANVDITDIDRIEISVDGQVVDTISPSQLENGPLGLEYTGIVANLDVAEAAQNLLSATVYLSSGDVSGEAELTILSGLSDTSVETDGTTSSITFGALSTFFDVDATSSLNVNLLGNNRDNNVVATTADGNFNLFGGNDTMLTSYQTEAVIDGGSGFDIVEYIEPYVDGVIQWLGSIVRVGFNTHTLSNVEEIHFSNAIVDTATQAVTFINSPPTAFDDVFSVDEDQVLSGNVLDDNGNGIDSDPDGDALTVSLISGPSEGSLTLNDDGSFTYEADADVFDLAAPGDVIDQTFTYQIDDGNGETDQATVTISVSIQDDGEIIIGTNKEDTLNGTDGGEDVIYGENANDTIYGLDGADTIYGGNLDDMLFGGESADSLFGEKGNDQLYGEQGEDYLDGGRGNDVLRGGLDDDILLGGRGDDVFVLALGEGTDTILDYGVGEDLIGLVGLTFDDLTIGQSGADATISSGGEVLAVLAGVDALTLDEADVFNFV